MVDVQTAEEWSRHLRKVNQDIWSAGLEWEETLLSGANQEEGSLDWVEEEYRWLILCGLRMVRCRSRVQCQC